MRPLISVDELLERLGSDDLCLIDARFSLADTSAGRAAYDASHLPGAVYLHLDDDLSGPRGEHGGRHPLPTPSAAAATFGRAGVGADTLVVAYDDGDGMTAGRVWWLLRWLGHDQVLVLDGGLLQFTTADFLIGEDDGTATITVERIWGSLGAVSVNYATADGTATAGLDYSATSGTLHWADGDYSDKSFTIPIIQDDIPEGSFPETVALILSSYTGGASPGFTPEAMLNIIDDEDPIEDAQYLIITSNGLAGAFQKLINHRSAYDGFTGKVLTITDINADYSGSDQQTRIRNAIRDHVAFRNTHYVVLGGDDSVVIDRDCYAVVGTDTETQMPTDLYYAGLDGNWDEDGDGRYGEANYSGWDDEGDLIADVHLGRIPVRTAQQAADYIAKVIAYDTNPSRPSSVLLAGNKIWNTYTGDNRPTDALSDGHQSFTATTHPTVSDAEMWMRRMYREHIQVSGTDVALVGALFDTLTSWDTSNAGDYPASPTNTVSRWSEGWNLALHGSHGVETYLDAEGGSFTITQAAAMTGTIAFFHTSACLSGAFDKAEPSFSEAMLRNPNGGALVYLGSSRFGWGVADPPPALSSGILGDSNAYMSTWLDMIVSEGHTRGGAAFYAMKDSMAASCGTDSSKRWLMFSLNYQGDPALTIRSIFTPSQPQRVISMRIIPDYTWSMNPGPAEPIPTIDGDDEVFDPVETDTNQMLTAGQSNNG